MPFEIWIYPIIVFHPDINDSDFSLSQAKELFHKQNNKDIGKQICLSAKDFDTPALQNILEIISDYIHGMPLEISEDNAIYDMEEKKRCLQELVKHAGLWIRIPAIDFFLLTRIPFKWTAPNKYIYQVIDLFRFAIRHEKNIYFMF